MAPSKPKPISKSKLTPLSSANKLKQDVLAKQRSGGPKDKLKAELKKLQAENDALRMVASAKENNDLIPRPVKGASRKGFKLQVAMALEDDDELYATLRRAVRDAVARAGIDYTIPWPRQPKEIIAKVITFARGRNEYFKRFSHGWPIEEFVKISLKNKRAYARRRGFIESSHNVPDEERDEESNQDKDETSDEDDLADEEMAGGGPEEDE